MAGCVRVSPETVLSANVPHLKPMVLSPSLGDVALLVFAGPVVQQFAANRAIGAGLKLAGRF